MQKCGVIYLREKLTQSDDTNIEEEVNDQEKEKKDIEEQEAPKEDKEDDKDLKDKNINIITTSNSDWDKLVSSLIKIRIEDCNPKTPHIPPDSGQRIEDEINKRIKKRLVECEGGSWPCPTCDKYFLAEHFVINHVHKKHVNKVAEIKRKVIQSIMMENYASDKNKIVGSSEQGRGGVSKGGRMMDNRNRGYRGREGGSRRDGYEGGGGYSKKHNYDYRDLDDPVSGKQSVRNTRTLINYDDI